jgi:putative ABC transport system permease protein
MSLSPIDLLKLTYLSLSGNLLRSALTCVGVFMGVSAVSATLQVGTISRAVVAKQLAEREAPQIQFAPRWQPNVPYQPFRLEDMEFFRKRLVGWRAIASGRWAGQPEISFGDRQANPEMYGVSEHFLETSGRSLVAGKFFTQTDLRSFRSVVIIDPILAENLFADRDAVGKRIYIDYRPYFVRGVMETKLSYEGEEPQGELIIPLSLHIALTGTRSIGAILIRPNQAEKIALIEEQTKKLLKQRFPDRDFWSFSNIEDIKEQQDTLLMVSRSLLAVGAIALLVGGVGIANITIATVMERTAEIGLRRAIGATQADIMLQFILEAALLSLIGGILAIGSVHGITLIVADTFELPYEFDPPTAGLALGSALLVGVGAGFFPALQASQLDPVKALRSG